MSLSAYLDYNRLRADMQAQEAANAELIEALSDVRQRIADQNRLLYDAYPYLLAMQSDATRLDDEFYTEATFEWLDRLRGLCQRVALELEKKP